MSQSAVAERRRSVLRKRDAATIYNNENYRGSRFRIYLVFGRGPQSPVADAQNRTPPDDSRVKQSANWRRWAMLVLPTSASADSRESAQKMLQAVVDQRVHSTMVVFGDGERPREIASRADRRAENNPFRAVVQIPDVSLLEGVPSFGPLLAKHAGGAEAVALTIRFELSSSLRGDAAFDFFELEQAFTRAGAGQVEP
jgi:hypothetical protein